MFRIIYKSKLHNATVTDANLNYTGSITIDSELLKVADIFPRGMRECLIKCIGQAKIFLSVNQMNSRIAKIFNDFTNVHTAVINNDYLQVLVILTYNARNSLVKILRPVKSRNNYSNCRPIVFLIIVEHDYSISTISTHA